MGKLIGLFAYIFTQALIIASFVIFSVFCDFEALRAVIVAQTGCFTIVWGAVFGSHLTKKIKGVNNEPKN